MSDYVGMGYADDYESYGEYYTSDHEPYDPHPDHICLSMTQEGIRRQKEHGGPPRNFVIKFKDNKWMLFSNYVPGMEVVQCPFCSYRFWRGNQVTIE